MKKTSILLVVLLLVCGMEFSPCQATDLVNPLSIGPIGDLPMITEGESRVITYENPQGLPGEGGKAGEGRKGAPCLGNLKAGEMFSLMDIPGCGVIRHIWLTIRPDDPQFRNVILRMYWDGSEIPSVEAPLLDFAGEAHGVPKAMYSALTTVTEGRGFNFYFSMPFEKSAKITLENDSDTDLGSVFYQIDYELLPSLPANTGRFHAQWRRQNPTEIKKDYVILDKIDSPGVYIGTMIGVRTLGPDWWGEGEMKFYINDDKEFPTICGTGTEDYFNSAWGLGLFQSLYHGCTLQEQTDYQTTYISMYRWHVPDPVRFKKLNKLTIQQIGWNQHLFDRSDDWCSMAFWYQLGINKNKPPFPSRLARDADLMPLWNKIWNQ